MRRTVRTAIVAAGVGLFSASAVLVPAVAAAQSTTVPLSQKLRNCDFAENPYQGAGGYGRVISQMRIEGAASSPTSRWPPPSRTWPTTSG